MDGDTEQQQQQRKKKIKNDRTSTIDTFYLSITEAAKLYVFYVNCFSFFIVFFYISHNFSTQISGERCARPSKRKCEKSFGGGGGGVGNASVCVLDLK